MKHRDRRYWEVIHIIDMLGIDRVLVKTLSNFWSHSFTFEVWISLKLTLSFVLLASMKYTFTNDCICIQIFVTFANNRRLWDLLSNLSKEHEITFISFLNIPTSKAVTIVKQSLASEGTWKAILRGKISLKYELVNLKLISLYEEFLQLKDEPFSFSQPNPL